MKGRREDRKRGTFYSLHRIRALPPRLLAGPATFTHTLFFYPSPLLSLSPATLLHVYPRDIYELISRGTWCQRGSTPPLFAGLERKKKKKSNFYQCLLIMTSIVPFVTLVNDSFLVPLSKRSNSRSTKRVNTNPLISIRLPAQIIDPTDTRTKAQVPFISEGAGRSSTQPVKYKQRNSLRFQ